MGDNRIQSTRGALRSARRCASRASVAALAVGLTVLAGCNEDEAWTAFRGAATTSLQTGFRSVASGVVDGLFAVFELGADETGGDTTGGSAASGDTTTSGDTSTTSGG